MISITSAVLVLALACMAATTAAQPSGSFSMTPSDLPEFLYMHPIPTAGVKLYYTPHSPMRSKVLFGIAVPRGGWVGIGWSRDCRMNGSDSVIGGIGMENAAPATYSLTTTATPDPALQAFVNSFTVRTMPDQLSTLLTVDRAVGGGRVALTGPSVCLIWAYSNSTDGGYHGPQRRGGVPITVPAIGGRNGSGGDVGQGRGTASMPGVAPASKAPSSPSISPSPSSPSSPSSLSSTSSLETPGTAAPGSEGPSSAPAGIGTSEQSTSVPGSNPPTQEGPQVGVQQSASSAGNPKSRRRIGHVEAVIRVFLAMVVTLATLKSCMFD